MHISISIDRELCCREIEVRYNDAQNDHLYAGIYGYYYHFDGRPVYRKLTGLDAGLGWIEDNNSCQVFMFATQSKPIAKSVLLLVCFSF